MRYRAAGNGKVDDAAALQRAVDACAAGGGGTVLVPSQEMAPSVSRARVSLF
jgi:polygalacturonase